MGAEQIARVAEKLASGPYKGKLVYLLGFTDSQGLIDANIRLSQERAASVQRLLGATSSSTIVEAYGFGPERAVASNSTNEGRARNRRVELWLKK